MIIAKSSAMEEFFVARAPANDTMKRWPGEKMAPRRARISPASPKFRRENPPESHSDSGKRLRDTKILR
jgi:hypothetical protein